MTTIPQGQTRIPPLCGDPTRLPGILFVIGCQGDTVRYRCYHPQEQLARHGVRATTRLWTDPHVFTAVLNYDIFILHRVMYTGFIPNLVDLLHDLGKVVVFDTDDLVFDPTVIHHDSLLATMRSEKANLYRQSVYLHAQTLDHCDYALVPTRFLADWLRQRGKQTLISRNALNDAQVQISETAWRHHSSQENKDRVVVGYFSGSPSHDRDFAVAAPALLLLMERYSQVHLRVGGYLSLDDRFSRFSERVQQTPYVSWQELPYAIRQVDINIAPLELDNPFCQSKSELKYFEAGAVGVPTVASPTDAFKFAITHGENGLLANTIQEWLSDLELLTLDPVRRREVGEAAHRHVLAHYTSAVRGAEMVSILNQIWHDWRERFPAPTDLRPTRHVINHLTHYLDNLGIAGDLARIEELVAQLVDESSSRQRPWHRTWALCKRQIKERLRLVYEREFFDQVCVLSPELTTGREQGGHLTSTQPNLYRIDIPFATYGRINTADVIFHLQASPKDGKDLATVRISAAWLRDNQPYRFTFEPISDSQGREFYFYLESPGAFSGNAVSPWLISGRQQPVFALHYLPKEELP